MTQAGYRDPLVKRSGVTKHAIQVQYVGGRLFTVSVASTPPSHLRVEAALHARAVVEHEMERVAVPCKSTRRRSQYGATSDAASLMLRRMATDVREHSCTRTGRQSQLQGSTASTRRRGAHRLLSERRWPGHCSTAQCRAAGCTARPPSAPRRTGWTRSAPTC